MSVPSWKKHFPVALLSPQVVPHLGPSFCFKDSALCLLFRPPPHSGLAIWVPSPSPRGGCSASNDLLRTDRACFSAVLIVPVASETMCGFYQASLLPTHSYRKRPSCSSHVPVIHSFTKHSLSSYGLPGTCAANPCPQRTAP